MRGQGHSGLAGRGPVRLAAEERVRAATARVAAAERALVQARARLDDLHKAIGSGDEKTTHEAENQLQTSKMTCMFTQRSWRNCESNWRRWSTVETRQSGAR